MYDFIRVFPQLPEYKNDRSDDYILPCFSYVKFITVIDKFGGIYNFQLVMNTTEQNMSR